jgi:DNA-binding cell septation regulator SpoVG
MDIRVRANELKEQRGIVLAAADLEFGDLIKVRNLTIKEGKNGLFVSMPSYATSKVDENGKTVFKDVFRPINAEASKKLTDAVLESLENGTSITIKDDEKKLIPDIRARINPLDESKGSALAIGSLYLNEDFVVDDILIRKGMNGEEFVSYPSYKTNELDEYGNTVFKDFVYPKDREAKEKITKVVMSAFEEAKKKQVSKENTPERKGIKDKLKEGEEKSRASAKTAKSIEKKKEAVL